MGMMKSGDLNGKKIESVQWPDGEINRANNETEITYNYEYHGTYDDAWIVVTKNGTEITRHNVQYVASLVWMPI